MQLDAILFSIHDLGFQKEVVEAIKDYFGGTWRGVKRWLCAHFNTYQIPYDKQWRSIAESIEAMEDHELIKLWAMLDDSK